MIMLETAKEFYLFQWESGRRTVESIKRWLGQGRIHTVNWFSDLHLLMQGQSWAAAEAEMLLLVQTFSEISLKINVNSRDGQTC